ncbi:MAG: SUMF1/EgtB/PvdO family nonheme iron enzyme, partial [Planctomycetes bacterium]|nr:SUMF1/EgtB/PvdO family nonheme iron enzyme [Planctomycetota bacterium]
SCEYAGVGVELGVTPLRDAAFFPGYYRVVLEVPGYGHAELSRWLGNWKQGYDLGEVPIRAFAEVCAGMVRFEAGEAPVKVPVHAPTEVGSKDVMTAHGAFLIDRHEVSNAHYLEFFEAMGGPTWLEPGQWWRAARAMRERRDPAWMARPVVGVSWRQAAAYSEWAGKRLPSDAEWTRAAIVNGDGSLRPYPWGSDEPGPSVVASRWTEAVSRGHSDAMLLDLYMQFVEPVTSLGQDVTPDGLLHMGGNVGEWTDTVALGNLAGQAYPLFTHRKGKGWNWMRKHPRSFDTYEEEQAFESFRSPMRGFRCAVSILP